MINLEDSVGLKVKIVTNADESIQGIIHSYNPHSGVVSLVSDDSAVSSGEGYSKNTEFRIVRASFIKSAQALNRQKTPLPSNVKVDEKFRNMYNKPATIPVSSIANNFRHGNPKAIQRQQLEFKRRRILGERKLSVEGEAVFNQLYNLLPEGDVTFDKDDSIVIFDNHLIVLKPYKSENCKILNGTGEEEDQQLSYIRKVIKDIWDRLETERKGG
ncbi:DEKNAAC101240 [Brettanomyces naardenensis]|uniref:DEKNAAC101241 n=1 Tax=Brettanomyces naardenensis TaxID=13370 RepID=A0A448YHL0_BRENA|nr:DEKNAAC101240 [Brettanomyces naardenensis]